MPTEAEVKTLRTSTRLSKETRIGFESIEAEVDHGIYWSNKNKLKKLSKQLSELQSRIDEGLQEMKDSE